MTVEELQAQVDARWATLELSSWPSPRPFMRSPRQEEYSRVTDPGRYRIVHERARVWTQVLAAVPGVRVERLPPGPLDPDGHLGDFDRGVRVTSDREGTLPLLLLERDAQLTGEPDDSPTLAVLHLAIVEPTISLEFHPTCGCDACDSGSQELLRAIDEPVTAVVGGPFVALRGRRWQTDWHPGGGSSQSSVRRFDHDTMLGLCRRLAAGEDVRLPRGTRSFVGRSWLVST